MRGRRLHTTRTFFSDRFKSSARTSAAALAIAYSVMPLGRSEMNTVDGKYTLMCRPCAQFSSQRQSSVKRVT